MFRTFRRLQIFALGSLLVGCATSPPTSLTSFHPPLQVTSLIDIESKKPSKMWVLFDERPAASIYIPPDRTTERGTHREGDTLNLYPKRSRFLEWHPPLTALIPALIIEAPILLVAKVTQSEEPSRQTPVAPASEVIALHQKYLSWMEKIASDEQYLSEHDAYFVETFKMTRRAQTERAAILADERESANLATAAFDREKFVLELGIHRILFLILVQARVWPDHLSGRTLGSSRAATPPEYKWKPRTSTLLRQHWLYTPRGSRKCKPPI